MRNVKNLTLCVLFMGLVNTAADEPVPPEVSDLDHTQITHTGWIHRGCVAFKDQDDVISKGPITSVKVCHAQKGYIYGLQLYYGGQEGGWHGLTEAAGYGLKVEEWVIPEGEHIVKVEGQIEKYYISRLRFITDKGNPSPQFGGKEGKPFVAADPKGLPLRTIAGYVNLRRHPSLNRACTSMTFHFSDKPVKQPSFAPMGRVPITDYEHHLLPFHYYGETYLFGLSPSRDVGGIGGWTKKPINNAANWWFVHPDPSTGFTPVVQRAKMFSDYFALTSFALNGHPYIFGLHAVGANIWRIKDDPSTGFELVMYKGRMSSNYEHVVSFQLKGEPYILGLHRDVGANIWRIRKMDPSGKKLKFELIKYKARMSPNYEHLCVFYLNGHPYVFGKHADVGANIWRIKDPPSQGLHLVTYGARFPKYDFVRPLHVEGKPYLYAAMSTNYMKRAADLIDPGGGGVGDIADGILDILAYGVVEWGKGYGVIWEIGGDPWKPSVRKVTPKAIPISHRYTNMITFEQGGKAYIFGIHEENYANIWRLNDDPAKGFSLVYYGRNK